MPHIAVQYLKLAIHCKTLSHSVHSCYTVPCLFALSLDRLFSVLPEGFRFGRKASPNSPAPISCLSTETPPRFCLLPFNLFVFIDLRTLLHFFATTQNPTLLFSGDSALFAGKKHQKGEAVLPNFPFQNVALLLCSFGLLSQG